MCGPRRARAARRARPGGRRWVGPDHERHDGRGRGRRHRRPARRRRPPGRDGGARGARRGAPGLLPPAGRLTAPRASTPTGAW
ncbi:MAG: hypothetical protein AVDCRST_MAG35-1152 [uncultured Quadrisphaera sp.]|uniref:Uncharacterized protein n=1 Tax=uncultured Quadrisphaera sp. TaxID=904978 RepID=A0A6J4P494_9ACTN|nr:MAG: hypothetical protein AVDCRST_MAG35-1152 [uncultured Quadrisphaera sp.]